MGIIIRKLRPEDLHDVIEMLREFAEFEKLAHYCTATKERFAAAFFDEGSFAEGLVFESKDGLAGYAVFFPHFSSFRGERGLYLEDIFIKPEFRGGGTGRAVLSEIARLAAARGFERIDFQVLDWNTAAIDFYKRLGAESNDGETHFKFAGDAFRTLSEASTAKK
jgi:GNAT superfamily N-acetyltransferase